MTAKRQQEGIWVIGATFGAYYARALASSGITAIVGRGAERGKTLADALMCDYFSSVEQALENIPPPRLAIIAVRSSVMGGAGDQIAHSLLKEGTAVLQELPIHTEDIMGSFRIARQYGARFGITAFYDALPPVRHFTETAHRLAEHTVIRSVEMRTSIQVLHCALCVLSDILQCSPSGNVATVPTADEGKVLVTSHWGKIPVDIVLLNQMDQQSPDNGVQPFLHIVLITDEGELILPSPFGQFFWQRRLQQSIETADAIRTPDMYPQSPLVYASVPTVQTQNELQGLMTEAIQFVTQRFATDDRSLRSCQQRWLSVLKVWQLICAQIERPKPVKVAPPHCMASLLGWG